MLMGDALQAHEIRQQAQKELPPSVDPSCAMHHDLVFGDEPSGIDEEFSHLDADITLQLDDSPVLRITDDNSIGFERLLQRPEYLVEVHWEFVATLRETDLLWESSNSGPRLAPITLLHADMHLALTIILAGKATRCIKCGIQFVHA